MHTHVIARNTKAPRGFAKGAYRRHRDSGYAPGRLALIARLERLACIRQRVHAHYLKALRERRGLEHFQRWLDTTSRRLDRLNAIMDALAITRQHLADAIERRVA